MNDALHRRLAALTGLALAAAVTLWWLGSSRLDIEDGSDTSRTAAHALQALWLARGMALALLGVRVGAAQGWRTGATTTLGLIAPAWPLVVLAWSASTVPLVPALLAELGLVAAGLVLPVLGRGLRRVLRHAELAETAATALGVALAAGVWLALGIWAPPLT